MRRDKFLGILIVPKRAEGSLKSAESSYLCSLYFAIKTGMCSIYSAEGRFFGSTYKRLDIIPDKSLEYCEGIFGYTPFVTFVKRPFISFAVKGGLSAVISYKTAPIDHMSLDLS